MIRIVPGLSGHDVWIACEQCRAVWMGQPFDICEWCEEREDSIRKAKLQSMLNPEFSYWGDRYTQCTDIDRQVWALTRGFEGGFEQRWLRTIRQAFKSQDITRIQLAKAVRRYRQWKATQMKQSLKS